MVRFDEKKPNMDRKREDLIVFITDVKNVIMVSDSGRTTNFRIFETLGTKEVYFLLLSLYTWSINKKTPNSLYFVYTNNLVID